MPTTRRITWEDFGPFLRAIRTRQHLTQDELAERLGFGRVHICRLEVGTRCPSRTFLRLLASLSHLSETERTCIQAFEQMRECRAGEGEA